MMAEIPYCSFHLGNFLFGLEAARVQEVLRGAPVTPIPLAAPGVVGMLNLRGQVVTVLDLKKRLGLEETGVEAPYCVILKDRQEWMGILVDQIGDVLTPPVDSFEPTPVHLSGETRQLMRGVFQLRKRILLCLDLDKALNFTG
jgi:purine-binding chemotaxis protein CheW